MIFHLLFYGILWIKSNSKKYFDDIDEEHQKQYYDNESLGINSQGLYRGQSIKRPNSLLHLIYIMKTDEIEIFCCIINTAFLLIMFFMYIYDLLYSRSVDDVRVNELVSIEKSVMLILCIASLVDYFLFTISLRDRIFSLLRLVPYVGGSNVYYYSSSSTSMTHSPPNYYLSV